MATTRPTKLLPVSTRSTGSTTPGFGLPGIAHFVSCSCMRSLFLPLTHLLALASWGLAETEWKYTTNTSNEATIYEYLGDSPDLIIPETVDGLVVRQIGGDWPYNALFTQSTRFVTNVSIPDSATRIGEDAFLGNTNLTRVTIGDGVTHIGDNAFNGNTNLTRVTIGGGVTNLGNRVFADCDNLRSVLFLGNAPNDPGDVFDSGYTSLVTGVVYHTENATGWGDTYSGWQTRIGNDSDGDGLDDAAETAMSSLGFDWQVAQPSMVDALYENANTALLFSVSQYKHNRTNGQTDAINNPADYNLYTSNSIMDLHLGGMIVRKQGTNAEVVLQIQTTEDLASGFTNSGPPSTNSVPMSAEKSFLRIRAMENSDAGN